MPFRSFSLIDDLTKFLRPMELDWYVCGGWAIDLHLGRITRKRADLDISVPLSDRLEWIGFFLQQDWQIEGKLSGGFKRIQKLSDYQDSIHYFWSFPKDVEFVGEYIDQGGNRRIAYNRDFQQSLDYIEVFFDKVEEGFFIYRRNNRIKRIMNKAILTRDSVRYLAPEVVLLLKSTDYSKKNLHDFDVAIDSLNPDALVWLREALSLAGDDDHPWLGALRDRN